jgi:hypothetical protein
MVYLQTTYELCFGEARSVLEKNKGLDLASDVQIMTSQQRLSRIVTSTFL